MIQRACRIDQQVRGLDVAVHDALLVSVFQGIGSLGGQLRSQCYLACRPLRLPRLQLATGAVSAEGDAAASLVLGPISF